MSEFELPGCDEIFLEYFDRWYSNADRDCKPFPATRPDIERHSPPNVPAVEVSALAEEGRQRANEYLEKIYRAATEDWPAYLEVTGQPDSKWIAAFDAHWDRWNVNDLIDRSDPSDFSNELLVLICEFGSVLGHVLRHDEPDLEWCHGWPYWESALHHPPTGYRINVFHWAIKKFSEYGLEDGYEAKLKACLEYLEQQVSAG